MRPMLNNVLLAFAVCIAVQVGLVAVTYLILQFAR